jgi:hypothetical protein
MTKSSVVKQMRKGVLCPTHPSKPVAHHSDRRSELISPRSDLARDDSAPPAAAGARAVRMPFCRQHRWKQLTILRTGLHGIGTSPLRFEARLRAAGEA